LLGHAAIFQRPFPCLVQRDHIRTAQTKVSSQRRAFDVALPFDHNPHNPTPRARWINDQIQPAAIAMPPSAKILHQLLCQLPSQGH
jgi:hypothetical protein